MALFAGRVQEEERDDIVLLVINPHWEKQGIRFPDLPQGLIWAKAIDTAEAEGAFFRTDPRPVSEGGMTLAERSVAVFVARTAE